jgi:hypothetical protein
MRWALGTSNRTDRRAAGRRAGERRVSAVARAIALAVVLAPLGACSTITDLFGSKDDDNYV